MSLFLASTLLLAGLSSSGECGLGSDGQPTQGLQSLLSAQEYRKYQAKPRYRDRIGQFRRALERYADQVEKQVRSREPEALKETLKSVSCLSQHILNEPTRQSFPKHLRSKQTKKLEIALRKLVDLLRQAKYSFSLDMQQNFDQSAQDLDKLRDQMLEGIFGQPVERQDQPPASSPGLARISHGWPTAAATREKFGLGHFLHQSFLPSSSSPQRRSKTRHQEFTEEELDGLRTYQDLKKRVEIFLKIAESRLNEIHLRMTGQRYKSAASPDKDAKAQKKKKKKKKKKDAQKAKAKQPNPLEFYTYADLVYGYQRAIDGITINVDDKYKRTPEKELRKALKKLNGKIQEFIPRLAPVKQLAIDKKDEDLYRQVERAERISDIALKGSQMFLGAPEK